MLAYPWQPSPRQPLPEMCIYKWRDCSVLLQVGKGVGKGRCFQDQDEEEEDDDDDDDEDDDDDDAEDDEDGKTNLGKEWKFFREGHHENNNIHHYLNRSPREFSKGYSRPSSHSPLRLPGGTSGGWQKGIGMT